MKFLLFDNSPRFILAAQRWMAKSDLWYATMDQRQVRTLLAQAAIDVIIVRKLNRKELWRVLGPQKTEGMPGGRQIVTLPRWGGGFFLRRYLRTHSGG